MIQGHVSEGKNLMGQRHTALHSARMLRVAVQEPQSQTLVPASTRAWRCELEAALLRLSTGRCSLGSFNKQIYLSHSGGRNEAS